MNRMKSSVLCFAVLLSSAAFAQGEVAAPPPPKVVVLPFAALSGDVPQRAGQKAAAMLSNELKNLETVQFVQPQKAAEKSSADRYAEGIARARALVEQAKDHRKNRKFRLAEDALNQAVGEYRVNAAGLSDVAELMDAYALLSAVLYNTGRDEEGYKALLTSVSFAPSRDLPLAQTSALFSRVVLDTRKSVQLSQKGSLSVESTPSGAQVTVDGITLGATPIEVKDVPPGTHVWRVLLPSGEVAGGMVEIAPGKQTKVAGQTTAADPEARALSQLSQNKLDDAAVKAITEVGKSAEADVVLFGGMSRDGKNLALDAFVLSLLTNEVRRLPRLNFDTELLSAGMEFYNLAGDLSKKAMKTGEVVRTPATVATAPVVTSTRVAVAQYGIPVGKGEGLEGDPSATDADKGSQGDRKPLEPVKRKPLKR